MLPFETRSVQDVQPVTEKGQTDDCTLLPRAGSAAQPASGDCKWKSLPRSVWCEDTPMVAISTRLFIRPADPRRSCSPAFRYEYCEEIISHPQVWLPDGTRGHRYIQPALRPDHGRRPERHEADHSCHLGNAADPSPPFRMARCSILPWALPRSRRLTIMGTRSGGIRPTSPIS